VGETLTHLEAGSTGGSMMDGMLGTQLSEALLSGKINAGQVIRVVGGGERLVLAMI